MKEIKIKTEFIKLDQLLKFAEISQSGGESKVYIMNEEVTVNGKTETQRGKKIRPGDIIAVEGFEEIIVK